MEILVAWIVIIVLVGVPILTAIPLIVIAIRKSSIERHRLALIHYYFCGHPQVVVPLAGWKVPAAGIRMLASQRGYVEVGSQTPNTLAFRLTEAVPSGPAVTSSTVASGRPTRRQLRRRRQLTARLTSGDIAWVQPRELGIGMAEIGNIAQAHGFRIARIIGNHADPAVLLSRTQVWRLSDAVDPEIGRSLTSLERRMLVSAVAGVGAMGLGISLFISVTQGLSSTMNLVLFVLGIPVGIAGLLFPFAVHVRDTTHRMSLMIREFDGRAKFAMYAHFYLLDRFVIGDVANELGYAYVSSNHGIYGTARWNDTRIVYMRTPKYQPRGAR